MILMQNFLTMGSNIIGNEDLEIFLQFRSDKLNALFYQKHMCESHFSYHSKKDNMVQKLHGKQPFSKVNRATLNK